jgi:lipopolysaccharide/colanic/teichoic acid biosynthesis glycosyltransferase
MNLIIVHKNNNSENCNRNNLLKFALTDNPAANVIIEGFSEYLADMRNICVPEILYALPGQWSISRETSGYGSKIIQYDKNVSIPLHIINGAFRNKYRDKWFVISNGRYFARIDENILERVLENIDADVISINPEPGLLGGRDKIKLTAQGNVAGFFRLYSDSAIQCPIPEDWPVYLFVKPQAFIKLMSDGSLSLSFSDIMKKINEYNLTIRAAEAGGAVLDLEKEEDLLLFNRLMLIKKDICKYDYGNSLEISDSSKLVGRVLTGKNIKIGPKTVIIGPAVIGDNVIIEEGSLICSSIIGSNSTINKNQTVYNRIIDKQMNQKFVSVNTLKSQSYSLNLFEGIESSFKTWSRFSYPRFFKRIADIIVAVFVLTLFAPFIPFIAAAIKFTSPGPVFYGDKRQGMHGKVFHCLKFRSMITGANEIQDNLRFVSQVDGPQFKMEDDPRISFVGRFLRETYIDEIPQFFNVLFGQMSVVGPRPSPEKENTLCPFWRDARLSVRPGITGLWQIFRTRQPMKDFQEWIYYDTDYVKNLSLKMDLMICWKTAKKLLDTFINQF